MQAQSIEDGDGTDNDSTICSGDNFPFVFYDASGNTVPGETAEGSDVCIFPRSACGRDGAARPCCEPRAAATGTNYMFLAFALILLPQTFVQRYFAEIYKRDPELLDHVDFDKTPGWIRNNRAVRHLAWLWEWGIWIGMAAREFLFACFLRFPFRVRQSNDQKRTLRSGVHTRTNETIDPSEFECDQ